MILLNQLMILEWFQQNKSYYLANVHKNLMLLVIKQPIKNLTKFSYFVLVVGPGVPEPENFRHNRLFSKPD